ncbi:MAG: hypothetical protein EPN72_04640 [Nevskiaceae bacterium]|nr:MAG: hypothetical protein EPN63_07420 [Nevskiaceae bacterium]TBR74088.1 MAG: hypothetical protein EPN72_04640 [Nevskiaceae bacterium]
MLRCTIGVEDDVKVPVHHLAHFDVACSPAAVFDLVADVPRSVSHFPGVAALVPLGDNAFRWEMEPINLMKFTHRIVYACRYVADPGTLGVMWTPVAGVGNSVIHGHWRLGPSTKLSGGAAIEFESCGELDVPVPALLRKVAAPVVEHQYRSMVDAYHANLRKTLEAA